MLKVDGGATVNDLLMQLQADVLGVPVVRPVVARRPRSAPPTRPAWPPECGSVVRTLRRTGRPIATGSRNGARTAGGGLRGWQKAVERTLDGWTWGKGLALRFLGFWL